jgi:hypothetical protein
MYLCWFVYCWSTQPLQPSNARSLAGCVHAALWHEQTGWDASHLVSISPLVVERFPTWVFKPKLKRQQSLNRHELTLHSACSVELVGMATLRYVVGAK